MKDRWVSISWISHGLENEKEESRKPCETTVIEKQAVISFLGFHMNSTTPQHGHENQRDTRWRPLPPCCVLLREFISLLPSSWISNEEFIWWFASWTKDWALFCGANHWPGHEFLFLFMNPGSQPPCVFFSELWSSPATVCYNPDERPLQSLLYGRSSSQLQEFKAFFWISSHYKRRLRRSRMWTHLGHELLLSKTSGSRDERELEL